MTRPSQCSPALRSSRGRFQRSRHSHSHRLAFCTLLGCAWGCWLGCVCVLLRRSCMPAARSCMLAVGLVVRARCWLGHWSCARAAQLYVRPRCCLHHACCLIVHAPSRCTVGCVCLLLYYACALLSMPICPLVFMCKNATCCVTEELCDGSQAQRAE